MSHHRSVVIDNGSFMCKAGFGGESSTSTIFPSIVGKRRHQDNGERYVGYRATSHRGAALSLNYPVDRRVISNFDDMELIWNHVFYNELRVLPNECRAMLSEQQNPKKNRETTTQIMFENLQVPGMCLVNQAVLSLYASDRVTGIVLDSGFHVSQSVPVYEGYALQQTICRLDWAGEDLVDHMMKILSERGYYFQTSSEKEIVREMKDLICYVAFDFEQEMNSSILKDENYELPDGNLISVGNERFRCTEALFQPSLIGLEEKGIQEIIYNSIGKCDIDIRNYLYSNIVLSGGTCLFKGLSERISKELSNLTSSSMKINIHSPKKENCESVWIGGSILASLSSFDSMWININEYKEVGSSIIHRKCF